MSSICTPSQHRIFLRRSIDEPAMKHTERVKSITIASAKGEAEAAGLQRGAMAGRACVIASIGSAMPTPSVG
eukprot:2637878-Prymnesium_polylepis.1